MAFRLKKKSAQTIGLGGPAPSEKLLDAVRVVVALYALITDSQEGAKVTAGD